MLVKTCRRRRPHLQSPRQPQPITPPNSMLTYPPLPKQDTHLSAHPFPHPSPSPSPPKQSHHHQNTPPPTQNDPPTSPPQLRHSPHPHRRRPRPRPHPHRWPLPDPLRTPLLPKDDPPPGQAHPRRLSCSPTRLSGPALPEVCPPLHPPPLTPHHSLICHHLPASSPPKLTPPPDGSPPEPPTRQPARATSSGARNSNPSPQPKSHPY